MKKVVLVGAIALLSLASCSKEKGCTDPSSINYSASAEENDNSCAYEGNVIFYYDQSVASTLVDEGYADLTYYINNELVGSSSSSVYFPGSVAPSCDVQGLVKVKKSLGSVKTLTYTYSVKSNGDELWSGSVAVNANTCHSIQLTEASAN
jgi:hypothetical protein